MADLRRPLSKIHDRSADPSTGAVMAHIAWMRMRAMSEASVYTRRQFLRRLAEFFNLDPGDDLLLLEPADLDRWQATFAHLMPASRRALVIHVREFYRWAVLTGLIDKLPTGRLVVAKTPRRLPRPIADQDLHQAITTAPERLRPMLVLAAYCGLRAAEIAGLQRENIMENASTPIMMIRGKGDKERLVPLSGLVLRELQAYGLPASGPVFPRRDGRQGHIEAWTVSHLAAVHLHGLGIDKTLHTLRHYFGTAMYAASKDLRMVQEVMGHQSPETTAGYAAWSPAGAAAAVEAIARAAELAPVVPLHAVKSA